MISGGLDHCNGIPAHKMINVLGSELSILTSNKADAEAQVTLSSFLDTTELTFFVLEPIRENVQ